MESTRADRRVPRRRPRGRRDRRRPLLPSSRPPPGRRTRPSPPDRRRAARPGRRPRRLEPRGGPRRRSPRRRARAPGRRVRRRPRGARPPARRPRPHRGRAGAAMTRLTVHVPGTPIGQGAVSGGGARISKRGRQYHQSHYHTNRKLLLPWREDISDATKKAMAAAGQLEPLDGPLMLEQVVFLMPRGKTVRRPEHTIAPDLDHLLRAL